MKQNSNKRILPSDKLVLGILNGEATASEDVLIFYERYIQEMATDPVYAADGSRMGYFYDEDLAQELRLALSLSLPTVRKVLINNHFTNQPSLVPFIGPVK